MNALPDRQANWLRGVKDPVVGKGRPFARDHRRIDRRACRELFEQGRIGAPPLGARGQVLRLALAALAPRLRWLAAALAGLAFGVRVNLLFWLLAPVGWPVAQLLPGPAAVWAFCHLAARALLRGAGVPLQVQGPEHLPRSRACVVVCNHGSYLDGLGSLPRCPRRWPSSPSASSRRNSSPAAF